MPLITDNLVVAGEVVISPAPKKTSNEVSFEQVRKEAYEKHHKPEQKKPVKYIKKHDGELIRHINIKSQYLRDTFEDF